MSGARLRRTCASLVAAVLLGGATNIPPGTPGKDVAAILIVARTNLPDPNFRDSVVLVMNNLGVAPAGLILNRPTRLAVGSLFPDNEHLSHITDKVYFGGPVDFEALWFLLQAPTPPANSLRVLDGVYLSDSASLLRELLSRDQPTQGLRIFVGHAGWAPGQLEHEIGQGDWTLNAADADSIFHGKSERPWPEVPLSERNQGI